MRPLKLVISAGIITSIPCLALADVEIGDKLGTSEADIRSALEAQGYQIEEIEFEDGEIQIELIKDGVETELDLSRADGTVIELERE